MTENLNHHLDPDYGISGTHPHMRIACDRILQRGGERDHVGSERIQKRFHRHLEPETVREYDIGVGEKSHVRRSRLETVYLYAPPDDRVHHDGVPGRPHDLFDQ